MLWQHSQDDTTLTWRQYAARRLQACEVGALTYALVAASAAIRVQRDKSDIHESVQMLICPRLKN